jgi:hypothetical protein
MIIGAHRLGQHTRCGIPSLYRRRGVFAVSLVPISRLELIFISLNRQQYYNPEVVDLALLTVFKRIVTGGNAAR